MTTPTPANPLSRDGADTATLTVAQVAAATQLSTDVIYDQISEGHLIGRKVGRAIRVLRSDFHQWLESLPVAGDGAA